MNKSVWNRVDNLLSARKRTWASLARDLGYTDQRVSNWKRRGIPAQLFPSLCSQLGVSLEWLATGEGSPLPGGAAPSMAYSSSQNNNQAYMAAQPHSAGYMGSSAYSGQFSDDDRQLLKLWQGLTKAQKKQCLRTLEEQKLANDAVLRELGPSDKNA
jgi:hypothetical protein